MALKLVGSFSDADYPYLVTVDPHEQNKMLGEYYFDGLSSVPMQASRQRLINALHLTGIKDYRLFEHRHKLTLHLKTQEALSHLQVALSWKDTIAYSVEHDLSAISRRLLKKRCIHAANVLDASSLRGRFYIEVNRPENCVKIVTYDKAAFFETRRLRPEEHILGIDIL